MPCAPATIPRASILSTNVTGWGFWCSPRSQAGSTSETGHGKIRPARTSGKWFYNTGTTHPSYCGVCVSTRAWTMTNSTPAPTPSPMSWIPAVKPQACATWKKAVCWKMYTPTTISRITAGPPGPSPKKRLHRIWARPSSSRSATAICSPPSPSTPGHGGRSRPCATSGCRMRRGRNTQGALAGVCSTIPPTRTLAPAIGSAITG